MTTRGITRPGHGPRWIGAARWLSVVVFVLAAAALVICVGRAVTGASTDLVAASRAVFPIVLVLAAATVIAIWWAPRGLPRWVLALGVVTVGGFVAFAFATTSYNTQDACSASDGPSQGQWEQVAASGVDLDTVISFGPGRINVFAGQITCTVSRLDGSTELEWQIPMLRPIYGVS